MHPLLHEQLWQQNQDLVLACEQHPFCQGIASGSLSPEAFRRYVAQDAFFLKAFFQAYASIAGQTSSWQIAVTCHQLQQGVLDELQLHANYARELKIELDHVTPFPATLAYTEFLRGVASHEGEAETLAALTPCMRLYAELGQRLRDGATQSNPYRDWIVTYASDEFAELASTLERLLDQTAPASHQDSRCAARYRTAMECELQFFSAPLAEAST